MKRITILLTALLFSLTFKAQLAVTNTAPYNTPTYLVNNVLLGSGVTATNITFSGDANQLGYFSNGLAGAVNPLGLDSGLVFSTGNVNDIPTGGNTPSTNFSNPGDLDLLNIAQTIQPGITSSNDAAILEFDFVPDGDTVEFRFVFASDEYKTFINSVYNDIFSFFISGPGFAGPYTAPAGFPNGAENLAVVPGTTTPITISTIYVDPTETPPSMNGSYYIDNPGENTFDFNGYTTVISIKFVVNCNVPYHFKFAIADCQDGTLDTGVFMEGSSFSSNAPIAINFSTATTGGDTVLYEGCTPSTLNLTRSDTTGDLTVNFAITGTATNGVDYSLIADSVTYLSGIDTASLTIIPLTDAFIEGTESIVITTTSINACGNTIISSDSIFITDIPTLTSISIDTAFRCPYDSVLISANVTGSIAPYNYVWTDSQGNTLLVPDTADIFVPALVTDTFYVTATGHCNLINVTDTIIVTVAPLFTLTSTQNDTNICANESVTFSTAPSTPGIYTYNWSAQTTTLNSPINDSISIGTFTTVGYDTIFVTVADVNGFGCTVKDTLVVHTFAIPTIIATTQDTTICINGSAILYATPGVSASPLNLIWDNGLVGNGPHPVNPTVNPTKYLVYAENANNCTSEIDTIIIDLFHPIIIAPITSPLTPICKGESTTIKVSASGGGTGLIYTYIDGGNNIIGATAVDSFIVTPSYDGEIFTVIVSDSCTTPTDTVFITSDWTDVIIPLYEVTGIEGCAVDPLFLPTFQNTTDVDLLTMTSVEWNFGDGNTFNFPFATAFPHHFDDAGEFDVVLTITDQYNCVWDTVMEGTQIISHANPKADFTWNPNPTDYLNAELTFNNNSIDNDFNQWLFITDAQYTSDDFDPVFQFPQDQPGNYDVNLIVTSKAGCVDSITKIVVIDDVFLFYIPTGFTPNGDDINETFKVVGEGLDLSSFKMTIFNKWGELVFESNNPDIGWDGTRGGSLVPDGVYIWKIEVKEAHSPIIHHKDGFISIVK